MPVEQSHRDRRLLAFARTAARIACSAALPSVLDDLAAEVLAASDATTCIVVIADQHTHLVKMVGASGQPPGFLRSLEAAWQRGAPFLTFSAFDNRAPRVGNNLAAFVASDDRFAPLASFVGPDGWHSLVAVPLIVRAQELGVLTAFYSAGRQPSESEIAFLTAMADQAAVAVNTAQLFAEVEEKAALEERHRLARELHDSIAQGLYSIALHTRAVQLAAERADQQTAPNLEPQLEQLRCATESTLADMRSLIVQMRAEPPCVDTNLVRAIRGHAETVAARSGVEVVVASPDQPLLLAASVENELFRVVAEALDNSVRHGAPRQVTINLRSIDGQNALQIEIIDDGTGFDTSAPAAPDTFGQTSMRERIHRLGGHLTVRSGTGGTTVSAAIPCRFSHV